MSDDAKPLDHELALFEEELRADGIFSSEEDILHVWLAGRQLVKTLGLDTVVDRVAEEFPEVLDWLERPPDSEDHAVWDRLGDATKLLMRLTAVNLDQRGLGDAKLLVWLQCHGGNATVQFQGPTKLPKLILWQ